METLSHLYLEVYLCRHDFEEENSKHDEIASISANSPQPTKQLKLSEGRDHVRRRSFVRKLDWQMAV